MTRQNRGLTLERKRRARAAAKGVVLTHAQRKATEDAAKRHPKDGAGARKL